LRIFFSPIIIISADFGRPARARPGVRSFRAKGEPTVADVHVYVNRPAGKEGTDLEDLEEASRISVRTTSADE
jgi:hypothetical protein